MRIRPRPCTSKYCSLPTVSCPFFAGDRSISESQHALVLRLSDRLVQSHEPELHDPGRTGGGEREAGRTAHGDGVAGLVAVGPEVLLLEYQSVVIQHINVGDVGKGLQESR